MSIKIFVTPTQLAEVQAAWGSGPAGETLPDFEKRISSIVGETVGYDPGANALTYGQYWAELVVEENDGTD